MDRRRIVYSQSSGRDFRNDWQGEQREERPTRSRWLRNTVLGAFACFAGVIAIGSALETPASTAARGAKEAVRAQLKDGSSAVFRDIRVYRLASGLLSVCGEVNSRNSFGGMAGFTRFAAPGGSFALLEEPLDADTFEHLVADYGCDGSKGSPVARLPD